ncbi:MAG TPA: GntR family transcriptional regulator [Solirubrobacteraceae bacterium]|jgi:DNA-binding GntR family transcriptional regulator
MDMQISISERTNGGAARGRVYSLLRDAIVSSEFHPGQRLSEKDLANRLGVSRTPIREALVRLRDDRLVEIVPQLGTYVSRISHQAISDAQFVRESLECAAVRVATEQAGEEDLAALDAIVRSQHEAYRSQDIDRFYFFDDELHRTLCDLSSHGIAWSLSQRASGHLNRIRRLSMTLPDYVHEMIEEHETVVGAVRRRQPEEAEQALREHLRMVLTALPDIEQEHPEYFQR